MIPLLFLLASRFSSVTSVLAAQSCGSTPANGQACANVNGSGSYTTGLPRVSLSGGQGNVNVQAILQIVFASIGAMAVIIIIIAGLKYVISNGDPQDTARAKDTIIYAAIGLAIALSAEIIVTFVLNNI